MTKTCMTVADGGPSHGHDTGNTTRRESAKGFTAAVRESLDRGRRTGAFRRLYVVAAPAFADLLRKQQSPSLRRLIRGEPAKHAKIRTAQRIRVQLPERP